MWSETRTQIGTLKVRGAPRDDPALRLAVSGQLGGLEFRPSGMPPAAILIVRQLSDPLPGQVPVRGAYTRRRTDWERAVKDRLGELYRHAVCPSPGQAAGDVDAVIFVDEAELLACLVLDLSRRIFDQCWWWEYFSKRLSTFSGVSGSIRQLLSEKIIYVPAVLDYLTNRSNAGSVIRALSADDALSVLCALTEAYSLEGIRAGLVATQSNLPAAARESTIPLQGQSAGGRKSTLKQLSPPSESPKPAPWRQWLSISNLSAGVAKEQTCLLGMGLMLHRKPSIARSSEFQKLVIDWWNIGDTQSAGSKISSFAGLDASAAFDEIQEIIPDGETQRKSKDPPDEAPKTLRDSDRAKSNRELEADAYPENLRAKRTQRRIPEQKKEEFISLSSENPEPYILPETKDFVSTRLGGILYLINLMAQLHLPHCFEKDWRLASRLGAWGLLELLGRALLEDSSGPVVEDPLWAALAELDGRQHAELLGKNFTGNEAFRMPTSWFQIVSKDRETFRWAAMRRRLRLWSAAGYLMLEIPRDENAPHHQAQLELQSYMGRQAKYLLARSLFSKAPIDCPANIKLSGFNEALLGWLAFTLPYIHYRLHLALETDSGWNSTIAKQIFECPGKLYVTSTHVDFVTDINNISIPVRRAGLDRDPGWNPDLGRVVQFHFE